MNINIDTVWAKLTQLSRSSDTPSSVMQEFVETCSGTYAHSDWERLLAPDYDAGVDRLEAWLVGVLTETPPPQTLQALWVGLFNPVNDAGVATADMYVSGTEVYDPDDESMDWTCEPGWWPDRRYAASTMLDDIYRLAYDTPDGLGNDAEWSVCLMFAVTSVRMLLSRKQILSLLPLPVGGLPVFVGFDGGDHVNVGSLFSDGWEPESVAEMEA